VLTRRSLSLQEVDRRQDEHDPNAPDVRHRATGAGLFLNQFMNSTVFTLVLATALRAAYRVVVLEDCVAADAFKVMFHVGEV